MSYLFYPISPCLSHSLNRSSTWTDDWFKTANKNQNSVMHPIRFESENKRGGKWGDGGVRDSIFDRFIRKIILRFSILGTIERK